MGRRIAKLEQLRKFAGVGLDVPATVDYQFGRPLARGFWGEHVILKPTAPGTMSNGRFTFLLRTERVADVAPRLFPADHPIRKAPVLVQKFIDTGEYPESFRVLTLFGEPLYCMTFRQRLPRAPLSSSDEELLATPIASNAGDDYLHKLVDDAEVLAFARRAATAMPAIPLQGLDIIREAATGKLFVLENNSGGNTWHFSSQISQTGLQRIPREDRIAQFGAWDIAAKVLAERALKEAR
jgi:glutathione synthase/RimK-type ligase-like ATP-grasp enzyme